MNLSRCPKGKEMYLLANTTQWPRTHRQGLDEKNVPRLLIVKENIFYLRAVVIKSCIDMYSDSFNCYLCAFISQTLFHEAPGWIKMKQTTQERLHRFRHTDFSIAVQLRHYKVAESQDIY